LKELVDEGSNRLVCDRHRTGRSLSRAVAPEPLEYARNSLDIAGIANHGPDPLSLDPRGAVSRRHDQRGDAHRDRLIELGGDL